MVSGLCLVLTDCVESRRSEVGPLEIKDQMFGDTSCTPDLGIGPEQPCPALFFFFITRNY